MNALLVVDIQNDFLPGGALAVPDGDRVVPIINRLMDHFDLVLATQDWHPPDHGSFAVSHPNHQPGDVIDLNGVPQVLWPVHCVQHSAGAAFSAKLRTDRFAKIFQKGTDPNIDSYSSFFDNAKLRSTGLGDYLRQRGVQEIFVCGLATDYCVKYSVLDSKSLGIRTHVIEDACRGVNLRSDDSKDAVAEMRAAGASIIDSGEILRHTSNYLGQ
jgi:nicotinamidase/pyrazinamidase